MSLPSPNLDDRDFNQLLGECRLQIKRSCPEWTDLSPGDPGMMLLELFAHLTEIMIYRLNRLPDKAYVEFLRLLGVKILPPVAASVSLKFSISSPQAQPVLIPRGTRVTIARAEAGVQPPLFTTAQAATVEPGETETMVLAYHCELVEAELAGKGTGLAGLSVTAQRPPIVAPLSNGLDLVVGVEAIASELDARAPAVLYNGKAFRIWREVESFTDASPKDLVYVADRTTGAITFAPAMYRKENEHTLEGQPSALAAIPPAGREIRLWYCHGGGPGGNVAANTLSTLRYPLAGVQVSNPDAATGGRAAETLENALLRGPQDLHSLERAVTARDFELIALRSGSVARARALTTSTLWRHAKPGTVEVLLVPSVPNESLTEGRVGQQQLSEQQTEESRQRIQELLDERRPLGTTCLVGWVHYKIVRVKARAVIHSEEDPAAVKSRVLRQLYETISPLPGKGPGSSGWRFGQSLRASNVYDIILAEPGVRFVDQVRFVLDEVPEREITSVCADPFQPRTWYSATGESIFRSMNDGEGWERCSSFPGEKVKAIRAHPGKTSLLAIAAELVGESAGTRVHVTRDCGETWTTLTQTAFSIDDMAWMTRGETAVLFLATSVGLYELALEEGAVPVQVSVDAKNPDRGFFAVTVSTDIRGKSSVAAAARSTEGVYLSTENGQPGTFRHIGLKSEDIRVLKTQVDGPRRFLWAGAATSGLEVGKGCFRWELTSADESWVPFGSNWKGGSCLGLAFFGGKTIAATHRAGVLWVESARAETAAWQRPDVRCGLPLREVDRFHRVSDVAADPEGRFIFAGGPEGIYCSKDGGAHYESCSNKEFVDNVTLPETWLFCSGEHEIDLVSQDEAS
jgi:Baseplate J-like protein